MGLLFVEVLPRHGDGGGPAAAVLKCRRCRVDAASADAILSRDFRGRFGRAYLFDHVVNISLGPNEDRYLMTGLHTVKDIYCSCCQQILGWRYVLFQFFITGRIYVFVTCTHPFTEKAYEESEKYKEGKFILEKARMWKEAR